MRAIITPFEGPVVPEVYSTATRSLVQCLGIAPFGRGEPVAHRRPS